MMSRRLNQGIAAMVMAGVVGGAGTASTQSLGVARDTPAQQRGSPPAASGRIAGRVLGADNGRPVTRALIRLSAPELPGGASTLTDNSGAFEFTGLPSGRYTLTASKAGYIGLSFGQRRPRQAGTPLRLADGQELKAVDFRLPRGSAITGHVYDENGDPLPGAAVRAGRYQYGQGKRQLVQAGTAQTDDRGEYRVWGLSPGEYYISAIARNPGVPAGRGFAAPMGPGRAGTVVARGRGEPPAPDGQNDLEQAAYAPTYFPGVPSVDDARAVTIGLATEVAGIDFNVLLVRASRISGRVTNADGSAASAGNVNLIPEGVTGRGGPLGGNFRSRIQDDGAFSIVNVPPGRYVLRARGDGPRLRRGDPSTGSTDDYVPPQFARQPLTVDGDINNLNVGLAMGATISGTVTFQATQSTRPPQVSQFRIIASPVDRSEMGPNSTARIEQDGTFLLVGVPAGALWLRAQAPGGWSLKSAIVDARDTIDEPFEVRAGDEITGVDVTFTDRQSEINGTVTDAQGLAVADYTVLAFPTDSALWRPQARQIATARPDQTGTYQLRGLPPGDYYVATIDPAEQGEWFEPAFLEQHRGGATRVGLGEGDIRTQNFRVSSPR